MTKAELRACVRQRRATLDRAWRETASAAIQAAALALPGVAEAETVALYLALPDEVDTAALAERCLARGQRLCVPAWRAETRAYALAWLTAATPLHGGPLGVRQPAVPAWLPEAQPVGVAFAPGVAFDRAGGRVGHGAGHYDRMLAPARWAAAGREPLKVGLAFAFQVFDRVPGGPADIRMDWVVTEVGVARGASGAVDNM